ncbi:ferrous iron transport protein A [Candidatus Woesearchaeota archaeon]|nr:MAG: hypothetical protein QS99_C0001G0020 [archaeon GW2011_AR4]MBS3129230.1 ferrous iron transport protein A [Candidatus Woesearchaeota archaeon]HIH38533.1 ferrous iron transport protein A [Candidatus Woesearchaeota archaeon]HIH48488.1 ferrous iron transport protein A [Candidatus Woesearchaeota archaeon]HIJ02737.1 ferrous iron transport protein A [Candidatus Woesearchaeota archaeon]
MTMLLDDMNINNEAKVVAITEPALRTHLLKMGVHEGMIIEVLQRVAKGPMLLRAGSQEIAIGNAHLRKIEVELSGLS